MAGKRSITWPKRITTSVVEQLIRAEKDIEKAILIFDSATAEYSNGFQHDLTTFRLMIARLVSANHFKSAEELLSRMKEEKSNIPEDTFLSVCRGYARVHRPLEAMRVFHKMKDFECKPSPKSYIEILAILVEENQVKLALRFYKYMREMGVSPSVVSLNLLIKALCKNSGTMDSALQIFMEMPSRRYTPDAYTYGTLVNGLCKFGKIDDAKKLFEEMETKGCSPTVVTYTSLIHGLFQSGNFNEAKELFEDMLGKGIEPTVFAYTTLINGFCKYGYSSQAMQLLDVMACRRHMPNKITYSTLIHGLCQEGKIHEALQVFDRMKLQGLKPDAGLYGKIISGFCTIYKFHEAGNLLDEMVVEGISPNRLTWSLHVQIHNMVVKGLSNNDKVHRAFQLYARMRSKGISVDESTFNALIECFCSRGDLENTAQMLDDMAVDGCVPNEKIWAAVLGSFKEQIELREVPESLLELFSEIHQIKHSQVEA